MEISLTNAMSLITSADVTPSSEDAAYLGDNARSPQRPFMPWRTAALGDQSIVFDWGAARKIDLVLLVNANFTSARIQGNASNVWTSPSFNQLITIARNPQMWRYQHGVIVTGLNYRFTRVFIPSQTPVDGAAYYSLGGVWAGTISTLPRPFRWEASYQTLQPRDDLQPPHGGARQRISLGEPVARVIARAYSTINENRPMRSDQLADWMNIERQIRASDFFVPVMEINYQFDNAQVYVLRRVNQTEWQTTRPGLVESTWELEEVVGP